MFTEGIYGVYKAGKEIIHGECFFINGRLFVSGDENNLLTSSVVEVVPVDKGFKITTKNSTYELVRE